VSLPSAILACRAALSAAPHLFRRVRLEADEESVATLHRPPESSMLPEHHPLTAEEVLAKGGWHPRYARVIAVTSDGDYGFALIDGNGDGQELEAEAWTWQEGTWMANGSSGAGPLSGVGPVRSGGQIDNAYFAYGSAPGQQVISISFDGRLYPTPVNRHGIWAFIKIRTDPKGHGLPTPA
jgi:hypothetical protein